MTTLTVGAGKQYTTIAAAIAASRDGDVLAVQAGTYTNDFATINTKITIEGVGGMVRLNATQAPPNGKAILTTNTDVTIRDVAFSSAKVADGNGAGIRYQGGNLVVEDCLFAHEQVREVAAVGVADDDYGQRLRAFVVRSGEVSADELREHVKAHLARFKVPREIVFLDELPRNATGKVLKRDLADWDENRNEGGS